MDGQDGYGWWLFGRVYSGDSGPIFHLVVWLVEAVRELPLRFRNIAASVGSRAIVGLCFLLDFSTAAVARPSALREACDRPPPPSLGSFPSLAL